MLAAELKAELFGAHCLGQSVSNDDYKVPEHVQAARLEHECHALCVTIAQDSQVMDLLLQVVCLQHGIAPKCTFATCDLPCGIRQGAVDRTLILQQYDPVEVKFLSCSIAL